MATTSENNNWWIWILIVIAVAVLSYNYFMNQPRI